MEDANTDAKLQIEEDQAGYFVMIAPQDGSYRERRVVHMKKVEHGASGFVPSMPGVRAIGETIDDVRSALEKGIQDYIAARH